MIAFSLALTSAVALGQEQVKPEDRVRIISGWDHVISESRTSVLVSICVEPPLRRISPVHDQLFDAIPNPTTDAFFYFQPWRPYPRIAVAELEPPHGLRIFLTPKIISQGFPSTHSRTTSFNYARRMTGVRKRHRIPCFPRSPVL